MRLLLVFALAFLILPLSGCAKKKKDDSASTAASGDTAAATNPADGGYSMPGSDPAGAGHGDATGATYDPAINADSTTSTDSATDGVIDYPGTEVTDGTTPGTDPSQDLAAQYRAAGQQAPGTTPGTDPSVDVTAQYRERYKQGGDQQPPGTGQTTTPLPTTRPPGEGFPEGYNPSEGTSPETAADSAIAYPSGRPEGDGARGQETTVPKKATDVAGVKEGTAEFAAVSLILKIAQGEKEGLQSLISKDANGLLESLRSDDPEKALAEAKELVGRVQPVNSRIVDRDTVVNFRNTKDKVLQFYVRKYQGEFVVRDLRIKDAEDPNPRRR